VRLVGDRDAQADPLTLAQVRAVARRRLQGDLPLAHEARRARREHEVADRRLGERLDRVHAAEQLGRERVLDRLVAREDGECRAGAPEGPDLHDPGAGHADARRCLVGRDRDRHGRHGEPGARRGAAGDLVDVVDARGVPGLRPAARDAVAPWSGASIVSLPALPKRASTPLPPTIVSLPSSPWMVFAPSSPTSVSFLALP
jgi:hypothetical protein